MECHIRTQGKIRFVIKDLECIVETQSKQMLKRNAATIGLESDVQSSLAEVGISYFKTEFGIYSIRRIFDSQYACLMLCSFSNAMKEMRIEMFLLG